MSKRVWKAVETKEGGTMIAETERRRRKKEEGKK